MRVPSKKVLVWPSPPRPIEGWTQARDSGGKRYGAWWRRLTDDMPASITMDEDTGRYWLWIGDSLVGSYETPESAARRSERERERLLAECDDRQDTEDGTVQKVGSVQK